MKYGNKKIKKTACRGGGEIEINIHTTGVIKRVLRLDYKAKTHFILYINIRIYILVNCYDTLICANGYLVFFVSISRTTEFDFKSMYFSRFRYRV